MGESKQSSALPDRSIRDEEIEDEIDELELAMERAAARKDAAAKQRKLDNARVANEYKLPKGKGPA